MPQIVDPIFGLLTFHAVEGSIGWWTKQEHLDIMGSPVPLDVHTTTGDPTEVERQI